MNEKLLHRFAIIITASFLLTGAPCAAAQGVRLQATPQKFRAFYRDLPLSSDPDRVPAWIFKRLESPQDKAQIGKVLWRVEADAIIQESPAPLRLSFKEGLPVGNLRAIAVTRDGAVWAGGSEGLVRYKQAAHVWDRWQFFAGLRYLPSDDVQAIAMDTDDDTSVWVRTAKGFSHIEFRPMTLARKAAYFEERIEKRHKRHNLVGDSQFVEAGNPATSHQYPNDNDGLWTAMYAAAECFRYAVTKDRKALDAARKSVEAVIRLEEITGRKGYPARSFRHKSEPRHEGGFWYFTKDGEWEWKSDTSSDEIVGHFFVYPIAYDLLPDAELKKKIQKVTARIMDHILDNQYYLIDVTGKPTLWGRWSLDYFASEEGREDSPLNALELLSFLKVAHHITRDARYEKEYRKLIEKDGYHKLVAQYLKLAEELNYSDEELAMLSFYPLLQYEKDASLLAIYREGLNQWWKNIQREDNPLWIFIAKASHPKKAVSFAAAARTLQRIPMDLIRWSVKNSQRRDIEFTGQVDRHNETQITRLLAPDERRVMKWNSNPFHTDSDSKGLGEDDGAFFLLPYWMGRYHRFLLE
jgi:hypothetical protein